MSLGVSALLSALLIIGAIQCFKIKKYRNTAYGLCIAAFFCVAYTILSLLLVLGVD